MQRTSKLKQLAKRLLATTCLTAAGSAAAYAGALTPGSQSTFGTAAVETAANSPVTDSLIGITGTDWVEFEGLLGSPSFSSLGLAIQSTRGNLNVTLTDDTDTVLVATTLVPALTTYNPTGTVPADGNLFVEVKSTNEAGGAYSITLSSGVPEPATLATIGLGLAGIGVLGLRRRNKKS